MADDIGVVITGDRQVALEFDEFPERLRVALRDRISGLTDLLYERIWALAPVKSGRLRSLLRKEVFDDRDKITGRVSVSSEFVKAASVEYGVHAEFEVAGHTTHLDHAWGRAFSGDVFVKAYTRRVDSAGKRFLRGGITQESGAVAEALRETVDRAEQAEP